MTFKQKYQSSKGWLDKIKIITLYHRIKCLRHKDWSIRKTAAYFELSIGLISENLLMGNCIDRIEYCSNRKEALKIVKGK